MAVLKRTTAPTQCGDEPVGKAAGTKEGCKPDGRDHGAPCAGKAPFDKPTLKPYWGKPAVRNFRGDDGNVGIIRSPVRAIALPDNRHGVKDERALRVRTSDPLGLESCASPIVR
jgi:hypothetical protein